MRFARLMALVCAGLLGAILPQRADADEWNQKIIFTFDQPVEVPGQVLSPGTYVFKIMDSPSSRNVVLIYNRAESHLYGSYIAIPDYRMEPTGKPVITFEERAAGAPEAVHAWFYPGRLYGHQFLYPENGSGQLARTQHHHRHMAEGELAAVR